MSRGPRILRFASPDATAEAAARAVAAAADAARAEGGVFQVALAGGSTPASMYTRLAAMIDDWTGIRLWLGDERMVPPTDPDSNARMVATTLLAHLPPDRPTPLEEVRTDLAPGQAARDYADRIRTALGRSGGSPVLDMVILGIGEDGHTASLFPDRPDLTAAPPDAVVTAVADAPKPPPDRVTLTLATLNAARSRLILATGPAKAPALDRLAADTEDPHWPITLVERTGTDVYTDQDVGLAP